MMLSEPQLGQLQRFALACVGVFCFVPRGMWHTTKNLWLKQLKIAVGKDLRLTSQKQNSTTE
jgi:oxalate decarboxylase/phosphoglucose isomerase-like protein (cupin superfamily)